MKCLKIQEAIFESLFSDDDLGVTDEQKAKIAQREKRKEASKKASASRAETKSANKKTASELRDDNDNKRQKSLDGFEAPKQKHSDEDIKKFAESGGKVPDNLKSSAKKRRAESAKK